MANVKNQDLREEIYRSKLSFTDLPRKAQRTLPIPDLYVDRREDIPQGFTGLAKVHDASYLPDGFKPPFQPFTLVQDGETIASAFLSKDGSVSVHGRLTDRLGTLLYQLVTNYARKPNWSGYSYIEEMISFALAEAMVPVLRFDERRGSNPFSFLTTNTFFAFEKVRKKEAALAKLRFKAVEVADTIDPYTSWESDQREADNSMDAIYAEMCADLDLLFRDELDRRHANVQTPRIQKYKFKMSPTLSSAIKYGLKIGLSGSAIATHYGLEVATVSRVKNNVDRTKKL